MAKGKNVFMERDSHEHDLSYFVHEWVELKRIWKWKKIWTPNSIRFGLVWFGSWVLLTLTHDNSNNGVFLVDSFDGFSHSLIALILEITKRTKISSCKVIKRIDSMNPWRIESRWSLLLFWHFGFNWLESSRMNLLQQMIFSGGNYVQITKESEAEINNFIH